MSDPSIRARLVSLIPRAQRQRLRRIIRPTWLAIRRTTDPLSDHWGYDRGTPVDRYYIEQFLASHRQDIRGQVLEVKDSEYTHRYGVDVVRRDVLDINKANPRATIIADITAADTIPSNSFDCFILTQTMQYIYDGKAAVRHAFRILRPGGVLLVTVPTLSRFATPLVDYWRYTPAGCRCLFGDIFSPSQVSVYAYGNVLTAMAALTGLAVEDLSLQQLETSDERFPLIVAVRAVKQ